MTRNRAPNRGFEAYSRSNRAAGDRARGHRLHAPHFGSGDAPPQPSKDPPDRTRQWALLPAAGGPCWVGLTPISGPRGTSQRLQEQLRRLCATRFTWHTSVGLHPTTSGTGFVTSGGSSWLRLAQELLPRRPVWRSQVVLSQAFFEEITRSAVPVDLKAILQLKGSPFAFDLYVWLTYRMSYLRRPTVVPWEGLQGQFGADYARPRDFRRKALAHLAEILRVYPTARIGKKDNGLILYPSPPHVRRRPQRSRELSSPRAGATVGPSSVPTAGC